jgi:hypothetical protein
LQSPRLSSATACTIDPTSNAAADSRPIEEKTT